MERIRDILFTLAFLAVLLAGCHRETTVILPPATDPDLTQAPTSLPTVPTAPSAVPPATEPTAPPTIPSTAEPTDPPTAPPTTEPTEPPTTPPTTEPTEPPTVPPTTEPTEPPTAPPTTEPTEPPTAPPTTEPTEPSTAPPATEPTEPPTAPPTTEPTEPPTAPPATEPTEPSTAPPTTEPTDPPTAPPTTEPTEPTEPPTTPPTTEPTEPPTAPPTTEPTEPPTTVPTEPSIFDHPIGSTEWSILAALNQRRAADNLPPLIMDQPLCGLSAIRSDEYVQTQSDTRPDGRDWSTVLSDHGYAHWSHTEELRMYASSGFPASLLTELWMDDPDTKTQLLSPNYAYCGIGITHVDNLMYIVIILAG